MSVWLVVHDDYESSSVVRVYDNEAAAQSFVAAYNAVESYERYEVQEFEVGPPAVAYDGPIWSVTWSSHRKLKGEKQLLLVADGFTVVVPSAVPSRGTYSFQEYFSGASWRDLAAVDYEEPAVWIDHFSSRQEWMSGDRPDDAKLTARNRREVTARGISKEACEALVRANAIEVKAEYGM